MPPTPTPVESIADVRAFFDRFAPHNTEQHGVSDALLRYRARLLKHFGDINSTHTVLDLGCGDGNHLRMLAPDIRKGIGVDISPGMVQSAQRSTRTMPHGNRLTFQVDDARMLASITDNSVDRAICVGALEHMLNPAQVLKNAHRVLRPGGRFVALTLHGGYAWYRWIAPLLRIPTRHLETDCRLTAREGRCHLENAGFTAIRVAPWTFVPAGDMPWGWASVWRVLDRMGAWLGIWMLRGGLVLSGRVQN